MADALADADALLTGATYTGVRHFSSTHRFDTKASDIDRLLERLGVPPRLRDQLGVLRTPEIGIAGPVTASTAAGARICTHGFVGPVKLPADQDDLTMTTTADKLLIIENQEAAKYASRRSPSSAIFYTSGYMSPIVRHHLHQLAACCSRVWIICDADPDGV